MPKSDRYGLGDVPANVEGVRKSIRVDVSGVRPSTLQNPMILSPSSNDVPDDDNDDDDADVDNNDCGDATGTAQAMKSPLSRSSIASKHICK